MNLNAIKKKIRDEGLMKSAGYYSNRVISRAVHACGGKTCGQAWTGKKE